MRRESDFCENLVINEKKPTDVSAGFSYAVLATCAMN